MKNYLKNGEANAWYQPVLNKIADLQKRGFCANFNLLGNKIFCAQTNFLFDADEFSVLEMHAFDDELSEGEETVIYAIECLHTKGILMELYDSSVKMPHNILLQKISKFWK